MSRRTVAGFLALAMIVVLGYVAARQPTPYVTFRPGPTLNVLGDYAGKKIIEISGHPTYADGGQLRMVTIYPSGPKDDLSMITLMEAWIDRDVAVLPKGVVYKKSDTTASVQKESAAQMTSSQDNASAAALDAVGIKYKEVVQVAALTPGGAAASVLKTGDVILAANGTPIDRVETLADVVRPLAPGSEVTLRIRRKAAERTVTLRTKAGEVPVADPQQCTTDDASGKTQKVSLIGVSPAVAEYKFPFDIKVSLGDNIGGPSAGMMFALTMYDLLTPGSLTGGKAIAGSGEISPDGVVGPIGGIGQKLAGAQRDGAKLFLVAAENWQEAIGSHYDKSKMRLVKVHTLADAIRDVNAWRKDPTGPLPAASRCPA